MPKSREEFWKTKFRANVERDRRNARELRRLGWLVVNIWECEAATPGKWLPRIRPQGTLRKAKP